MVDFQQILEPFLRTLKTGSGFWNPIIWGIALMLIFLVIYIIRGFGKREYKEGTEQTKPFLSGNPEVDKDKMHVKGGNVYWGFTETLKSIYKVFDRMHTGNVSDYVLWFVIIMAIFFVVLGVI